MKVLLIKDVYNLGRAGEVKKVADGYARNFLIPQKMAVIATAGALKQIQKIEAAAVKQRELLNEEMGGLAEQIKVLELSFEAKIGETGKLYGSVTQQMIVDAINEKLNVNLDKRQVESQPLREEGEHMVRVRLTFDLIPEVKVIVESDKEKEEVSEEIAEESTIEESAVEESAVEEPAAEAEEQVETSTPDESAEEA